MIVRLQHRAGAQRGRVHGDDRAVGQADEVGGFVEELIGDQAGLGFEVGPAAAGELP